MKQNNCSALIILMMYQLIIPLNKYKEAHAAYSKECKNMKKDFKEALFKILSLWGKTFINRRTNVEYLMDFLDCEELKNTLCTILFPAKICKRLGDWLKTFAEDSMVLPDPAASPIERSASQPSMLPSPLGGAAHTSISFTPALGTSHIAGVSESVTCPEDQAGRGALVDLTKYHLKTSRTLSSISFNQGEYRCTLRSPNNNGDLAVKMEVYNYSDIRNKQPIEYWKFATVKGFVLARTGSRLGDLAAQMEQEMIKVLEADPHSEGELTYRK